MKRPTSNTPKSVRELTAISETHLSKLGETIARSKLSIRQRPQPRRSTICIAMHFLHSLHKGFSTREVLILLIGHSILLRTRHRSLRAFSATPDSSGKKMNVPRRSKRSKKGTPFSNRSISEKRVIKKHGLA